MVVDSDLSLALEQFKVFSSSAVVLHCFNVTDRVSLNIGPSWSKIMSNGISGVWKSTYFRRSSSIHMAMPSENVDTRPCGQFSSISQVNLNKPSLNTDRKMRSIFEYNKSNSRRKTISFSVLIPLPLSSGVRQSQERTPSGNDIIGN